MRNEQVITSTKTLDSFRERAEQVLYSHKQYGQFMTNGDVKNISIGLSSESGMHKINGTPSVMSSAIFCGTADAMMSEAIINPAVGGDGAFGSPLTPTMEKNMNENLARMASATVDSLISSGVQPEEAKKRVLGSLQTCGWYDTNKNKFVLERIKTSVNDSVLSGLTTPVWNISIIQKVFPQMFLRGYAEHLVSPQGVPNMWADLVQIFTTTFEGNARVSSVASGTGEFNTSVAAKNRSNTMISEVINLVIDYESPTPNELRISQQPGNWLGGQLISLRDVYANLMLRTLRNNLYYYGDNDVFDGLSQIANRDAANGLGTVITWDPDHTMTKYWDDDIGGLNATTGASVVKEFTHLVGDLLQELNFMPVGMRVACSPIVYKVLKFVLTSDAFVQKSPLSFISDAFEYNNKIIGTMSVLSLDQTWRFELMSDPMLMPNAPGNPSAADVMFITFPNWQSALDAGGLRDVLIAPVLIDSMILPSAPGYRDGTVRTNLSRIGSLLAPVEQCVYRINGFGVQ